MATPNINLILQAVFSMLNNQQSPSPQIGTLDFGNPTFGATAVYFDPFFQALAGGSQEVTLPAAKVYCFAVQNLSSTGNLQVNYTPSLHGQTTITIGPGGLLIYMDPTSNQTGVTELSLSGISAICPAMVLAAV